MPIAAEARKHAHNLRTVYWLETTSSRCTIGGSMEGIVLNTSEDGMRFQRRRLLRPFHLHLRQT